jgi:NAD(P)-dependent dehydrogenase (short-subunit alcohol dehydrogenase family)
VHATELRDRYIAAWAALGSSGRARHASKAAVRLMTKWAAVQHARDNIRANSVHPGIMGLGSVNQLKSISSDRVAPYSAMRK